MVPGRVFSCGVKFAWVRWEHPHRVRYITSILMAQLELTRYLRERHLKSLRLMSSQGTADSPQVKVIRSFAQGFDKMDADHIINLLHNDHRRVTYPRSLGRADENREEWSQRIVEVVGLLTECTVNHGGRTTLCPANSLLQTTFHSITEAPEGKVIAHVRTTLMKAMCVLKSALTPQFSLKAKTSIGVDMDREMIFIAHIAADEDGNLKIKQFEEFTDSKTYLEFFQGVDKAKASRQHSVSFAA